MTIDLSTVSLDTVIAGVALLVTIVAWLFDRFLLRRRRLVYRVQVDTPIGVHPQAHKDKVDVAVSYQDKEIADPSIVLIRIDNPGVDIEPEHFETPLAFEFPDREIAGLEVTRANSDDIVTAVKERLAEAEKLGPVIQDNKLFVPRLAINHGHGFKFLLVLSGTGRGVRHSAYLRGGRVSQEPRPRGPSRQSLVFGALSLLFVGALVALVLVDVTRPPDDCVAGHLTVVGSTAVEPVVKEIRTAYVADCTRAGIDVAATGSRAGTRLLADTGRSDPKAATGLVAMSDGRAENTPDLRGRPLAVVVFAVAVNRAAGVSSLTTTEIRDIYSGKLKNWSQLRGRNVPIRMVSRTGPDSGSRRVFRERVLGGGQELGISSDDCKNKDSRATYYRCEVNTTDELLSRVNEIDGAIGYADLGDTRKHAGITVAAVDGVTPDPAKVGSGAYTFWEIEYAYTYRTPAQDSLQEAFVDYLLSERNRPVLARDGLIPCADVQNGICG